jgi:hypothetical protein
MDDNTMQDGRMMAAPPPQAPPALEASEAVLNVDVVAEALAVFGTIKPQAA